VRWIPVSELRAAVEAVLLLSTAAVAVRALPFRWYAPFLGRQERASPYVPEALGAGGVPYDATAAVVRLGLDRAARRLPWHSTCLMRALAGRVMLRRRGCPATVYLGVARGAGGEQGFHAWVEAGAVSVSGGGEAPGHTVVSVFR
jgi:hypothetical protein